MSSNTPSRTRTPSNNRSPTDETEPLNIHGGGRFFSAEHNAWIDRRNNWPAGTALSLYQADERLVAEARRVIRAQRPPPFTGGLTPPPPYTRYPGPISPTRVIRKRVASATKRATIKRAAIKKATSNIRRASRAETRFLHDAGRPGANLSTIEDNIATVQRRMLDAIDGLGGWDVFEARARADMASHNARRDEARGTVRSPNHTARLAAERQSRMNEHMNTLRDAYLARDRRQAAPAPLGATRTLSGRVSRPARRRSSSTSITRRRVAGMALPIDDASDDEDLEIMNEDLEIMNEDLFRSPPRGGSTRRSPTTPNSSGEQGGVALP